MKRYLNQLGSIVVRVLGVAMVSGLLFATQAQAFCGFYVAKADTKLFNEASKVVVVRDEHKTVVTMASDYQGDAKEFAMVVPVPAVLKKGQVHITNNALIDHLDAYTAPRLVEYHDSDPCRPRMMHKMARSSMMMESSAPMADSAQAHGVKIEEEFTVGEYDILILSAKESSGLQTWLDQQGYKVPEKARKVLGSYLKQGMKFFVAKVNIKQQEKLGLTYLRPIQMAFESEKFMLPIRLGTVNSKGSQDMFVFALTKQGRVETTNYRTVKIPSNMDLPLFIKKDFDQFYKDMFNVQVKKENNRAVFLEYAWNMNACDPCAADPLSHAQLKELGVFWLNQQSGPVPRQDSQPNLRRIRSSLAANVYVTRLHVRYDAKNFPEDLMFQTTNNKRNYQGRYVMRHPWKGKSSCSMAEDYFARLPQRFEKEAQRLVGLTDWSYKDVRARMETTGQPFKGAAKPSKPSAPWWKGIWND
ncbi:MAG: DUF2330 domain-containing protein [Pseudomonadota bacterium]